MSIRIFISSVQKELELERAAVAALISTDPFLLQHCVPVLFEKEAPPSRWTWRLGRHLPLGKGCSAAVRVAFTRFSPMARGISLCFLSWELRKSWAEGARSNICRPPLANRQPIVR